MERLVDNSESVLLRRNDQCRLDQKILLVGNAPLSFASVFTCVVRDGPCPIQPLVSCWGGLGCKLLSWRPPPLPWACYRSFVPFVSFVSYFVLRFLLFYLPILGHPLCRHDPFFHRKYGPPRGVKIRARRYHSVVSSVVWYRGLCCDCLLAQIRSMAYKNRHKHRHTNGLAWR